jgi:2-dehydro-3-deoxy-L-rhamnonate dehydrogenase (NAD+)
LVESIDQFGEVRMPTVFDFRGRVTGGAQGIGRAIAERLLHGGATVWLWDRDIALARAAAAEMGSIGETLAVPVDVSDFAAVEAAAAAVDGGRIDILINNAGIAGPNMPTWDYPPPQWARVIAVNPTGTFNCCKTVAPTMIAQNYGRIVNIASIAGKEGNPNACAYSASKAGVIALTKSLGKELAGYDIAVNCVTPAVAKTAIFDQRPRSTSPTCSRRFRAAVSSRLRRSPTWWRSAPRRSARLRPAQCSISRAGEPHTECGPSLNAENAERLDPAR